jgi:hypothetical protein
MGIDFSKKKFDASLIERKHTEKVHYREFANTQEGCLELLHWVKQQSYSSILNSNSAALKKLAKKNIYLCAVEIRCIKAFFVILLTY